MKAQWRKAIHQHVSLPFQFLAKKKGLSERELAKQSKLSRTTLRRLFFINENTTLRSLFELAHFFQSEVRISLRLKRGSFEHSVFMTSLKMKKEKEGFWKIHLMNFVDELRRSLDERLIDFPPAQSTSFNFKALLASTVLYLCEELGMPFPSWSLRRYFLKEPWFLSEMESLKASAILESPIWFRKNNIFVLENFLSRV